MNFITGSYVGDGTASRVITMPVSWTPNFLTVKSEGAFAAVFATTTLLADGKSALPFQGQVNIASITALGAGSFTVNNANEVNAPGVVYFYYAIRDNGAGDFAEGKYTGDGTNNRSIALSFQADLAIIKRDNSNSFGVWRTSAHPNNQCSAFTAVADPTTAILSFSATAMVVGIGAAVNLATAPNTYYYVAMKAASGLLQVGSFVGNGANPRLIATTFQPTVVSMKPSTSTQSVFLRFPQMSDQRSTKYLGVGVTTAGIESFLSTGFNIGNAAGANDNGITSRWFAFGGQTTVGVQPNLFSEDEN